MEPTPSEMEAIAGMVVLGAIAIGTIIGLAINVVVCALLHNLYKAVPEEHRELRPGLVWLLLIPLFNLVWNFFAFPKLSKSYQNWFESRGDTSAGTCNSGLALAYAILAACMLLAFIPCVGPVVGLAGLVVLIIYLVKMFGLKEHGSTPPAAMAPPPPIEPVQPAGTFPGQGE